jgi:hypothetical protein
MQDDLRYAMKKLPEPLDVNLGYEEVRASQSYLILANRAVGCTAPRRPFRI